ncbi:putative glycolipid-binding domain-containing protein [Myxococcus sp. 1LA]
MNAEASPRGIRARVWRRLLSPGSEYFELRARPEGWVLAGSVVLVDEGLPHFVEYSVTTNAAWETQEVHVLRRNGDGEARLQLRVDAERRWWKGDEEVVHLRGCPDIDVACTPSTNTLPIRRLGLEVGQAADVRAAWIRIPSLALEVLPQRYTRLTETRYRYESNGGRFVAEVDVDADGIVTNYPPGWERVAVTGE